MPENENNNMPRRHISLGFLLSIVLVVGLIGILVWRFTGSLRNNATTFSKPQEYVQLLYDERIESASVTIHYGSEKVEISGVYLEDGAKKNYVFTTDLATYKENPYEYQVTVGQAKAYAYTDSDGNHAVTINTYMVDKVIK